MNKMVLIGGVVVLLGAAVGGTLFFTGAFSKDAGMPQAGAAMPEPKLETFYHDFYPKFVVNLDGATRSGPQFLQAELSVATHDEKVIDVIDAHGPELRNDLLTLLGAQDAIALKSAEGKQALREQARETIDAVVARHYAPGMIEDVFFRSIVMQ